MNTVRAVVLDRVYELLVKATGGRYRQIRKGYVIYPRTRAALADKELLPIVHHYYEPYVDERDLTQPLETDRQIEGLDLNEAAQLELMSKLTYHGEIESPDTGFGGLDGNIYYSYVRHLKPRRVVEIGSGGSAVTARAALDRNEAENPSRAGELIAVEPFENPWLEKVADRVLRVRVENCPDSIFTELGENDILFIDSTHMIRPQGDVLHEYLHLLGKLKPGVMIHVHDIFTPKDYPRKWVLEDRRMWNEQYLLEAFLCFNRSFKVTFAANYLYNHHFDEMRALCGASPGENPGSFWMQRVS